MKNVSVIRYYIVRTDTNQFRTEHGTWSDNHFLGYAYREEIHALNQAQLTANTYSIPMKVVKVMLRFIPLEERIVRE